MVGCESNEGFPAAANRGAQMASGDTLVFLNPDVVLEPGCLAAMAGALDGGLTVTGPALWVEAAQRFEYGLVTDWVGYPVELTERRKPLFVPGCALATRRATFDELGGCGDGPLSPGEEPPRGPGMERNEPRGDTP